MNAIKLRGVKTHNLKDLSIDIGHGKFYVITGVSGSGKSSLAFDTLYAEGQRRFVESLSAYARQFLERMERPDIEYVEGIPPAIAIEAKNVITNARSTVGTQTEINDYLRLLFARIGKTYCPDCRLEITVHHPHSVFDFLSQKHAGEDLLILFQVPFTSRSKKYAQDFIAELERQGFYEFFLAGRSLSAEELRTQYGKIGESLGVVADRLSLETKMRKQILDSLESAFRYGKGRIEVRAGKRVYQFSEALNCPECHKVFQEPTPNLFAFNSPLGACPECQGFGRVITLDWNLIIPDENKCLADGAIEPWTKPSTALEFSQMLKFCSKKKIPTHKPWRELSKRQQSWILKGCPEEKDKYFSVEDFFKYLETKTYKMHVRVFLSKYRGYVPCGVCNETRLKAAALWVKIEGKHIFELQSLSLEKLSRFLAEIKMSQTEKERAEAVYEEITRRIRFLNEVGLGYLSLSRLSRTLSGGEVERIHLATSLGSALVDTLYVLDEPSIGLHERDNRLLIRLLHELRDLGNTVVVVEHDRTMIEAADEMLDMGPLGGEKGGRLLYQGPLAGIEKAEDSLTGQYLSGKLKIARKSSAAGKPDEWIKITGAKEHNLKNIHVEIPLERFVVMTGVSGSGKSTLLYDILYHRYLRYRGRPVQDLGEAEKITGFDKIEEVILMDQSPIGRTPRSNAATYLKVFDDIRKLFASTAEAKREGYGPGHFSFNVDGGRCEVCKGDGRIKVEMFFLADVYVSCEECRGKRFKSEILDIRYRGKNIDQVLEMTADDAVEFFGADSSAGQKLTVLQKVGLGYLRLGQSALTFSGGEAQRLKLAYEITAKQSRKILYLFDEPTTGLHYHDIYYLMRTLEELLARGHSIVMIEHNMEVIKSADYVIDLGPEGGDGGGEVVYQGGLDGLLKCPQSHTGKFLKKYLAK